MKISIKKLLKIILPILLGVFLIGYSLSKVSFSELLEYVKKANYYWIALGVFFGVLSHLSRAYRWRFLLEPLNYKVKLPNSIMAVFSAYIINYTIPRAGEVARASILTTYEDVPFEKGFGTIVSERVADLVVVMAIMVITLFLQYDFIMTFLSNTFHPKSIVIMLLGLVLIVFLFVVYVKKSQSDIALKIKSFVMGLLEGVLSIFKMKKKWPFIIHTLFIWAMYVLMFYVTTFSVQELHGISFGAVLVGFISASFSIAATNGGIGSYPVAVYAAFSVFGIPEDPSLAFGWIVWASQTLMLVMLGGLSLLLLPIYNKIKVNQV